MNHVSSIQNDYKEHRLGDQIRWYAHKAGYNKITFRRSQNAILIASVGILVTNVIYASFGSNAIFNLITSLLGVSTAVICTITQLEKYYQNWVFYRRIAALLQKEKYFFENSVGEYDNIDEEQKNKILVQRIESIVSGKNPEYFTIRFKEAALRRET